ncbi:MAG: UbiA-like polyprenyltransferase [Thermoguttaceae bacterium]
MGDGKFKQFPYIIIAAMMFTRVRQLLEMIRFSHTLFALPFALLSALMAWTENARSSPPAGFRWLDLLGILACMAFARGTAMAFNRIADRRLDGLNPRTQARHLPGGVLSVGSAVLFTATCAACFVASTLLFLPHNWIPFYASAPVLLFLTGYSYAKRFTLLSHFWLGAALMLAPLGAWAAIRAEISPAPLVLGGAVLFWVAGFDIIYACQDFDFDVKMRLRSIPARFGVAAALRIAAFCHLAMVVLLLALPMAYPFFGRIYLTGVAVIAGLLFYEHWIVRPDDLTRVNRAFFHINAVISVGLLAIGAADLAW